jgi:hypothetical protein
LYFYEYINLSQRLTGHERHHKSNQEKQQEMTSQIFYSFFLGFIHEQ